MYHALFVHLVDCGRRWYQCVCESCERCAACGLSCLFRQKLIERLKMRIRNLVSLAWKWQTLQCTIIWYGGRSLQDTKTHYSWLFPSMRTKYATVILHPRTAKFLACEARAFLAPLLSCLAWSLDATVVVLRFTRAHAAVTQTLDQRSFARS